MIRPTWFFRLLPVIAGVWSAMALAAPPDKSAYTLWRPTPDSQLREFNPDRPDATEGPFTVDAGHLQLELDFARGLSDRHDGDRTREWDFVPFNLRLGLTNDFELGLFATPWVRQTEDSRFGFRTTRSGYGDVTLRGKINFHGNDGGPSACGMIVDVKLPVARDRDGIGNGAVEGDLILPIAGELPGGWEWGAMTKVEARHRDTGGTRGVWINSATLGRGLASNLSGYVELTSETGDGPHVATFNTGLALKLGANAQLDAGVNLGISRAAGDAEFFAGFSRRF